MAGHRLQWFDMAPQVFPTSFVAMGRVAVYFEAAAVIISLTLLGQILALKARSQTSAAIKSLLGLAPKTAGRINADGAEEDIALTHVHVGDTLRVRPGEKVLVDGVVVEGSSAVDKPRLSISPAARPRRLSLSPAIPNGYHWEFPMKSMAQSKARQSYGDPRLV